jgi:type III secretion protein Q
MRVFDLLPVVAPQQLHPINAVYRRRSSLATTIAGRTAVIAATWPYRQEPASLNSYAVSLRIDDADGELTVRRSVLDALIATADPTLSIDRLDANLAAIIVEFVLCEALAAVETNLCCRIELVSVRPGRAQREAPSLAFTLELDGVGTSTCELCVAPGDVTRLAQALDRCAGTSTASFDLPFVACLRAAAATLTVSEVKSLAPGSVVLLDAGCRIDGQAIAVIADHLVAPVELTPAGAVLAARPMRGRGSSWEWSMDNPTDTPNTLVEDSELGDLPVRLIFELGRIEIPLSQIEQLAPGALLPLTRSLDEPLDIMANGKRLGRGSLVRIGASLGVRVVSLVGHD